MDKEISPWLSIWVSPRKTMAEIIKARPFLHLWALSFISGFILLLNLAQGYAFSIKLGFWGTIALSVILAPLAGYLYFSIAAGFLYLSGKWMGGKASFIECRAAIAWSSVPLLINAVSWIVLLTVLGNNVLVHLQGSILTVDQIYLILALSLAQVAFAVWALVLFLYSLSEVQGFSLIKAIGNVFFAWVLFTFLMIFLWLIAMFLWTRFI